MSNEDKTKEAFERVRRDIKSIQNQIDELKKPKISESRLIEPTSRLVATSRGIKNPSEKLDIDCFSEKEKSILEVLFKHKDMALGYTDIAKVLNKSPNTIKNQINSIRRGNNIFEVVKDEQNKNRFKLREGLKIEKTLID